MSATNAERHQQVEGKGVWRTASGLLRCSNYFGSIASCARAIKPGQRYFDTRETLPDAGLRGSFKVCGQCGNAPHCADFLAERAS